MTSSVKIENEDKDTLEKLQAMVTLRVGRKTSQQEILSAMIRNAYARSDEFIEKLTEDATPLTDEEYEKILSLVDDWGVDTSWEELDELLYGTKRPHE